MTPAPALVVSATLRRLVLCAAFLAAVIVGGAYAGGSLGSGEGCPVSPYRTRLTIGTTLFEFEEARDERAWRCGLSFRQEPPPDTGGMLFDFGRAGSYGIWMKDMSFSIDIIWLDEDLVVIDVLRNISPASYPQVFTPTREGRYVIELAAGVAVRHGIEPRVRLYRAGE